MNDTQADALIEEVKGMFESQPTWLEKMTTPCGKEELCVIGGFIQTYCLADFNARRIIDALRKLANPPLPPIAGDLNETDVFKHLELSLAPYPADAPVKDGICAPLKH